jgi:undecaprenyl-diphosphatase
VAFSHTIQQAPELALKGARFVARHVWSISLSGLSAVAFLELASEVREAELGPFDSAVASWVQGGRGKWDTLMLGLTRFGEFPVLASVCAIASLGLALLRRRREMLYVLACGSGAALGCSVLKLLFQRLRPDESVRYLLGLPQSLSFPSGHAMGSIAIVGSLVIVAFAWPIRKRWRPGLVAVAVPLVLGVAVSRVYFGVHYPSDVIGGQLAGAAWVAALTGWFYPRLLPAEATQTPAPVEPTRAEPTTPGH